MKKYVILVLAGFITSGCSSVVTKNFKVSTDPPDAIIRVVSGVELNELKFSSPADITVEVPDDPALLSKAILEVSKDNYKPTVIALRHIGNGDTLMIKLEKIRLVRYRLTYRLVSPVVSQDLQFRDKTVAISLEVKEQSFQMHFENLSAVDVKILWERAEYQDPYRQGHRIMHSGIRYPDRNNPIPDQVVRAHGLIEEAVIPVKNVYVSQQKNSYDVKPLFPLSSEKAAGLKGKEFNLFIPVEINRQIIPYNFRIEINDSVKEAS